MRFKTYYLSLPVAAREELAASVGTTCAMLHQVAYSGKRIALGLADCLVARCEHLTLDDMPLSERAQFQRVVRAGRVGQSCE